MYITERISKWGIKLEPLSYENLEVRVFAKFSDAAVYYKAKISTILLI